MRMPPQRAAVIFFAVFLVVSCAAAPLTAPEVVLDRTACSKCGMLISDLAYSASARSSTGEEKTFDDLSCLISAAHSDDRVWVHDHQGNDFVDARAAYYVISPAIKAPMGGTAVAFASEATARSFAAGRDGRIVAGLAELVRQTGGDSR